ncbi:annexin D5-like protein [Tanacetum coccineum]
MSTLSVPRVPVNLRDDVIKLHNAFKGAGYDTAAVIGILAHRDSKQRSDIEQVYGKMYSEMLVNRFDGLSPKLHGMEVNREMAGKDWPLLCSQGHRWGNHSKKDRSHET